jgi:hypothetical protein
MHRNSCKSRPSFLQPPADSQDPGWLPFGPSFLRKDVRNDIWKTSGLISVLPFYYYRFEPKLMKIVRKQDLKCSRK